MRRSVSSVLVLFLLLFFSASALAAEPAKKAKGIPANPSKKKLKGIPASTKKTADSEELTEEEKAVVEKITEKTKNEPAVGREKVELPPEVLAARPPVVPQTHAPMPPALPPGDPNLILRQIPKPPKRIHQPELLKLPPITAPTDPTKKKKY